MSDRIESETLVEAGLAAMGRAGKPLAKLPSKGRAMLYALPNGETVRMRTCNDHVLIVVADSPSAEAKLNIEGTDWLLLVMPEVERTAGKIVSYLLPVSEVEGEARRTHREWLATEPNTKGKNTTWNLWFRKDAPGKANDYATKWAKYKLAGSVDVAERPAATESGGNVKTEVEAARKRIAAAAGVPVEAVKITINFEG
jgi:hypothetical protein